MPNKRLLEKAQVDVYASVLLDATQNAQEAFGLYAGLKEAMTAIRTHAKLNEALSVAGLSVEARINLVRELFTELEPVVVDVVAVMVERGDIGLIGRVTDQFLVDAQERYASVFAQVKTVVSLDDHLRKLITNKLKEQFGKEIVLDEVIDPQILGGIVISANGKRLDASLATQLLHARTVLSSNVSRGGEE